jgi:threonine 3-dehydrogenase
MAKLITGGTGYIGAELTRLVAEGGEKPVVFDIVINHSRIKDIEKKLNVAIGDVGIQSEVNNVIKENRVTEIFHLGSLLTNVSEGNHWGSFQTNVVGTYNIIEAARLFGVKKMMFTSTFGTYGIDLEEVLDDKSLQRPITMYGAGKLYGEGLGRFYHKKFGLDFRAVRFAHMIGPNVRTSGHWAPAMIEDAILGNVNKCVFAIPETRVSLIYVKDCARACQMVLDARPEEIKGICYNVTGIPEMLSAREIETALKRRFPKFKVDYQPDPMITAVGNNYNAVKRFDDSTARKEWGWKPLYGAIDTIVDAMQADINDHPERYGLAKPTK